MGEAIKELPRYFYRLNASSCSSCGKKNSVIPAPKQEPEPGREPVTEPGPVQQRMYPDDVHS